MMRGKYFLPKDFQCEWIPSGSSKLNLFPSLKRIILDQFVCCFRCYSANWMLAFLWPDFKRGLQRGFTYLRIPNPFIGFLIVHTDDSVFIWITISLTVILLLATLLTMKLLDHFDRICSNVSSLILSEIKTGSLWTFHFIIRKYPPFTSRGLEIFMAVL